MNDETTVMSESRHRRLGLSDGEAVDIYRTMLRARKFDERCLLLQRAGKINFHVSGIGQEAAQVAAAFALDRRQDYYLPYYRDYGFVLAVGMTVKELMLSVFAKAADPASGGRQMPGHFGYRKLRIVTSSSPVATQVPHAVGFALAAKLKGKDFASFVTFGEGSSNQGDVHEGMNFAGVHKLPVIFMCENNQYAISVPYHKQVGEAKIADRARGYGFAGSQVDGNDVLAVYEAVREARRRAAEGAGPTLIEALTYRLSPHSTSDDDMVYRTREEVESHRGKDGLIRFRDYMTEVGLWDEGRDRELNAEVDREIKEATEFGDKAPYPDPEETLKHVYGDWITEG